MTCKVPIQTWKVTLGPVELHWWSIVLEFSKLHKRAPWTSSKDKFKAEVLHVYWTNGHYFSWVFFFLIRPMSHSVLPECSHFWYLPQWLWPLPLVAGIAAYQAAQSQTAVPQFSWFPQRRNPRRVLGGVDEAHVCLQFALDEIIYILKSLCQRLRQSVSPAILFSVVV